MKKYILLFIIGLLIFSCNSQNNDMKNTETKESDEKIVLIAVSNKLLKQAFAIAKTGLPYEENFVSKLA